MFLIKIFIFHLTVFCVVDEMNGLVKLRHSKDSRIKRTEAVIRTANKLFAALKARNLKDKARLKQTYNHFISSMLQDHRAVKRIVKLTKVDKKTFDNGTSNFIDLINEILNTDSNATSSEQNDNSTVVFRVTQDLVNYVDDYLQRLIYYQNLATSDSHEIKNELFKNSNGTNSLINNFVDAMNTTVDEDDDIITNESEKYWVPDETFYSRRIFEGKRTKVTVFPFVVSLQILGKFHCGGSIIDDDLIITAASCLQLAYNDRFFRENPAFIAVRVGSNYYSNGGELIPIIEVYFHPEYIPKTLKNNIAIVRLVRKIKFSRNSERVKKISLDQYDGSLPETTTGITIIGWGADRETNIIAEPFVHRISYAIVDIYPFDECKEIYSDKFVTREYNFCAGFMSKGSGACNHDVGGPGVVKGYLAGIISFGSPVCGTVNSPTVFTKVGHYKEWIQRIRDIEIQNMPKKTTILSTRTFHPYIAEKKARAEKNKNTPDDNPLRMRNEKSSSDEILESIFDACDSENITELLGDDNDDDLDSNEAQLDMKSVLKPKHTTKAIQRSLETSNFESDIDAYLNTEEQIFLTDSDEDHDETTPRKPITKKHKSHTKMIVDYDSESDNHGKDKQRAKLSDYADTQDDAEIKVEDELNMATSGIDDDLKNSLNDIKDQDSEAQFRFGKISSGQSSSDVDNDDNETMDSEEMQSSNNQIAGETSSSKIASRTKSVSKDNGYKDSQSKLPSNIPELTRYLQYRNKLISNKEIQINSKDDNVAVPKALLFQLLSEILEAQKNKLA